MHAHRFRTLGAALIFTAMLATSTPAASGSSSIHSGALLKALREADDAQAARLIDRRVGLNESDESGATALMWAAQRQNVDLTLRLLQAGADPNIRDRNGLGPLQVAISVQASDVALLLIAHGADAKVVRDNGETALMTAARSGQLEVMKKLIAQGADVNAHENKFHQTALMWSAGHPEQVKLLIGHGADVYARTKAWDVTNTLYSQWLFGSDPWNNSGEYVSKKGGQSALFFAVQQDDFESVVALLDAGVNVDDPAADGSTALVLAAYKWKAAGKPYSGACLAYPMSFVPNLRIVNLLLDRGAKVTAVDAAGYTPLHGAVLALLPLSQVDKCRDSEAKPDNAKETSADPLEALTLVRRMLDLKADPNAVTRFATPGPVGAVRLNPAPIGSSPLYIAAESGNAQLVKLLLEHGGDPNLINKGGYSPLSAAAKTNDLQIMELLLAYGGDLKLTYNPAEPVLDADNNQPTPASLIRSDQTLLHIAAASGSYKIVPFLVARGVPLNLKNGQGETPLALADSQERSRNNTAKAQAESAAKAAGKLTPDPESLVRDTNTTDAIKRLMRVKVAPIQ